VLVQLLRSREDLECASYQGYAPVIAEPGPGFRGQVAQHHLGEAVSLSEARMTGVRLFRTPRMAARAGRDDLLYFCVQMAGGARVLQNEQVAEINPGDGVLFQSRGAWDISLTGSGRNLLFEFPRGFLPVGSAVLSKSLVRATGPLSPAMRLVTAYIGQLFGLAEGMCSEQRNDAALAGISLLTTVLRGMMPAVPDDRNADEVLLGMMRTHVRDHLADPRLSVVELARGHHVSVTRAYHLFARLGVTPGTYIREQRLLAARTMLLDPLHPTRPVESIGAAVGLAEPRTFSRAFQREFGMSPGRWRREHQASSRIQATER
jgi:AraC-like DNA-binding protein